MNVNTVYHFYFHMIAIILKKVSEQSRLIIITMPQIKMTVYLFFKALHICYNCLTFKIIIL